MPAALVARLAAHDWPGNVRQLANTARQLVIANRGAARIPMPASIEALVGPDPAPGSSAAQASAVKATRETRTEPPPRPGPRKPARIHEDELIHALRANRWRLQDTADQLGIPRTSLYHMIARSHRVRKASDLSREEIETCGQTCGGSVAQMADTLEVSERALRRRMGQVGLPT
jgi:two-component system nitrogen regulation response regulator GlnG